MFKPTKNKVLGSIIIATLVFAVYAGYFLIFYKFDNTICDLISCELPDVPTYDWIRASCPGCGGSTLKEILIEIISVFAPSFLVSYITLSFFAKKK